MACRRIPVLTLTVLTISCAESRSTIAPTPVGSSSALPAPPPAAVPTPVTLKRTIRGSVREVNGGPLAGVRVTSIRNGTRTDREAMSDVNGRFEFADYADNTLVFAKSGYGVGAWEMPTNAGPEEVLTIAIKLQKEIRISPGMSIAGTITSDDLTYSSEIGNTFWEGQFVCRHCKEVFVSPPTEQGGSIRLSWTGGGPLTLWAGDYYGGPILRVTGSPGTSALSVVIPTGGQANAIFLGIDPSKTPGDFVGPIDFELALN